MSSNLANAAWRRFLALAFGCVLLQPHTQAGVTGEQRDMYDRILDFPDLVQGGEIRPIWSESTKQVSFALSSNGIRKFHIVDLETGEMEQQFDSKRLRAALSKASPSLDLSSVQVSEPAGDPFDSFTYSGDRTIRFEVDGHWFELDLDDYIARELSEEAVITLTRRQPRTMSTAYPRTGATDSVERLSPDTRLAAFVDDYNLHLRDLTDNRVVALTTNGKERHGWSPDIYWSPAGTHLAATLDDARNVHFMPVVHWLKRQEEVDDYIYPQAGGPMVHRQPYFVDTVSGDLTELVVEEGDFYYRPLDWTTDGSGFLFFWKSRDGKKVDLFLADSGTGQTRRLWSDRADTFVVETMLFGIKPQFHLLSDGRFIVSSERDGWNQLYLYAPGNRDDCDDCDGGPYVQRAKLTKAAYPVASILRVDEENGFVYFTAYPDQDRVYDVHLMRVRLDGRQLQQLTEATGYHDIQFSPSGEYFLDSHSTVSRPPVTELRSRDGTLIAKIAEADVSALERLGWRPPEPFVVKAADRKTDLHGIMRFPWNFDRNRSYPVIEYIYGGPQVVAHQRTYVPMYFRNHMVFSEALAQLGFIVITLDARGTPERSKPFQDVVYQNWGRHEIADHAAALRQLAAERAYMDLSRVGIFGSSYGGYYTIRAMLQAPELYRVGAASAPATELDTIIASAIENYMGGPPQRSPEAYEYASNLRLAPNLEGKLLLLHPTSDVNAPFAHTMKFINALIAADRRYDLFVMPEGNHHYMYPDSKTRHTIWRSTIRDYFLEHLDP